MKVANLRFVISLFFCAVLAEPPVRGDPGKESAAVADLVKQLGDTRFARREAAGKELEAMGEKALPALREAAASKDLEIRRRSAELILKIMRASRKSKGLGLELAVIDGAEFEMGSPAREPSRRPDESQHTVRLTRPYYLGAYEVTQEEYLKLMKVNPSSFSPNGADRAKVNGLKTERFPVERVSWFDAVEFCNRLSKLDGHEPYYRLADIEKQGDSIKDAVVTVKGGSGYRLPSEAEWEYACRAGTGTAYHFGTSNTEGKLANFRAIVSLGGYGSEPRYVFLGRTAAVGSYKPNNWGLHDMHGNVGEWCNDWYARDYATPTPNDDPRGPAKGTHRVVRGGAWIVTDSSCRSASRFSLLPLEVNNHTGFRVCRVP